MDLYLTNVLVVVGLMVVTWLVSLAMRDASIVDPVWGLAFVVIAWATLLQLGGPSATASRAVLLTALVSIWGLRLAIYLAWRKAGMGEDFRYVRMRERFTTTSRWAKMSIWP